MTEEMIREKHKSMLFGFVIGCLLTFICAVVALLTV